MTIKYLRLAVVIVATLLVAACASTGEPLEPENPGAGQAGTAQPSQPQDQGESAESFGVSDEELQASPLDDPESPLSTRTFYFDYDSAEIRPESMDTIAAHGQFLGNNAQQHVRLEGHTDERGTREYNLALGERRAKSVRQLLLLSGANADQIDIISYGEEQPAAFGHDKQAWQQNRRVKIVY